MTKKNETTPKVKKLTTEEISSLQALNANYQQIFNNIGRIEIQLQAVEIEKHKLFKAYDETLSRQKEKMAEIKEKYGNVKINLKTWEIEEIESPKTEEKKE